MPSTGSTARPPSIRSRSDWARRPRRSSSPSLRFWKRAPGHVVVRSGEELVEQAEFCEQVLGGGVDGVAAEVTEEVGVLLGDGDLETLAQ